MDEILHQFKEIVEEQAALLIKKNKWQNKWDTVMSLSKISVSPIAIKVLQQELEEITTREAELSNRQKKCHADAQEIYNLLNLLLQSTPKEIQ